MTRKRKWEPEAWQWRPEILMTDKVQFWSGSVMRLIDLDEARQLVKERKAFISTDQAIVAYEGV